MSTDITEIKKLYIDITRDNEIAGVQPLNELTSSIFDVLKKKSKPELVIPLFSLYTAIKDIANSQEERLVTEEDGKALYNLLNDSIYRLLEDLEAGANSDILLKDTNDLIKNLITYRV